MCKRCCGTCEFYDLEDVNNSYMCTCGESPYVADEMNFDDGCRQWERRKVGAAWKRLFEAYIKNYDAIQIIAESGIVDEAEKAVHEHNLLFWIIKNMKYEVEKSGEVDGQK